jgi:hypothetical protein
MQTLFFQEAQIYLKEKASCLRQLLYTFVCQRGVSGQASVLDIEPPVSSVYEAGWARKMVWG